MIEWKLIDDVEEARRVLDMVTERVGQSVVDVWPWMDEEDPAAHMVGMTYAWLVLRDRKPLGVMMLTGNEFHCCAFEPLPLRTLKRIFVWFAVRCGRDFLEAYIPTWRRSLIALAKYAGFVTVDSTEEYHHGRFTLTEGSGAGTKTDSADN